MKRIFKRGSILLGKQQAAVVDHVLSNPVTVVSAGAGTGKTHTMIATVLHILDCKKNKVNIDNFILITFTNKAADEMKERLSKEIGKRYTCAQKIQDQDEMEYWFEQKERLTTTFIGTIHSFCSMMLRLFGYEERIPHETEMLMTQSYFIEAMQQTMDEAVLNQSEMSVLFRDIDWQPYQMKQFMQSAYDYIRNRGMDIQEVYKKTLQQESDQGFRYRKAVAEFLLKFHQNYTELKQAKGGADANDLLFLTANVLEKHGNHICNLFHKRYRYLFIDEFQDTDRLQKKIVNKLLPTLERILVVGDRKQSIYGFRGADDSVLVEIAKENGMDQPLVLSISRRPTEPLLQAQNILFTKMGKKYPVLKDLLSVDEEVSQSENSLKPFQYIHLARSNRPQRIQRAIQYVRDLRKEKINVNKEKAIRRILNKDICFLFRSNSMMNDYAETFMREEIPIVIDTGGQFFHKPEIIGCYYMIQAILQYPNDVAIDLLLRTPFLPIQPHDYNLDTNRCSWLFSDKRVRNWYLGMMNIRRRSKIDLFPKLLTDIYEFTRIREWYVKQGNTQAAANLDKLVVWSRELMNAEALTLQQFAKRLQLAILTGEEFEEARLEDGEVRKDAITFSTVHKAKGLQYPIVIIPEMQKPIFSNEYNKNKFFCNPDFGIDISIEDLGKSRQFEQHFKDYKKDTLNEEARVLYVAVTRAQNIVCFIGGGSNKIANYGSEYWSWKDEVLPYFSKLPDKLKGFVSW